MAHYIPVTKKINAKQLADVIIREIVRYHGIPESIVTDRGSLFTSGFWSSLCYALKIKRKLSTAFHPQIDGQTERQNNTMEQYLRAHVNFTQDNWVSLLPMTEFAYNSATHASTGISPFEANIGYNPRKCYEEEPDPKSKAPAALDQVKELHRVDDALREVLESAQLTQARWKDKRTKPSIHKIGDKVWLNAKNIRTKRNNKLKHRLFGPFKVLDIKGESQQAYELELPASWNIHSTFHVSLLEKDKPRKGGDQTQPVTIPPEDINIEGDDEYVVEELVDSRHFETGAVPGQEEAESGIYYLVQWKGYEEYDRTWEPYEHVAHLKRMLRRFHEDNEDKPDGRSLTPVKRGRKKSANIKQQAQPKQARKQPSRRGKASRLMPELELIAEEYPQKS